MDQRKPQKSPDNAPKGNDKQADAVKNSRRQFVMKLAKKSAYIAPAVIALSANKSAMASGSAPS